VLIRIFGPKKEEEIEKWNKGTTDSIVISTLRQIIIRCKIKVY
jgi:hypothetical protein